MSEINDGGPAFPVQGQPVPGGEPLQLAGQLAHGMTLRDYFAGQVLQGMFASDTEEWHCNESAFDSQAVLVYKMADAMLKARKP